MASSISQASLKGFVLQPTDSHARLVKDLRDQCRDEARKFFDTLTADEKELYSATKLSVQLLDDFRTFDEQHAMGKGRRFAKQIEPFIAAVEGYSAAMDVLSNTSSDILCPIWGSIRVVLHLARSFIDYFARLVDMIKELRPEIPFLDRSLKLAPQSEALKLALVQVYKNIFYFVTEARKVFVVEQEKRQRNKLTDVFHGTSLHTFAKVTWQPFEKQFGGIQKDLKDSLHIVQRELELSQWEAQFASRQTQEAFQRRLVNHIDEQIIEKVNNWLSPADVGANHKAAGKLHQRDTGGWLLESDEFKNWLASEDAFLWVNAIAGGGKTILAYSIIEYLWVNHRSDAVGVAYFYCDYNDPSKQSPSKVLSTLLHMLGRQSPVVFAQLQKFYQKQQQEGSVYKVELDEIRNNFSSFVLDAFSHVYVVVDALDECGTDWKCLADSLKVIGRGYAANIKVLVTSRNEPGISRVFKGLPTISITHSNVEEDLRSWIAVEIKERIKENDLELDDQSLEHEIVATLINQAQGMFQWAKCQIDFLCSQPSDEEKMWATRQGLPKTMFDTYSRILDRIIRDHPDSLNVIRKLFRWLARSKRTLTVDEIAQCLAIDLDEKPKPWHRTPGRVSQHPLRLIELCSSLIKISQDTNEVSLAHYSAKEFLVSNELKKSKNSAFYVGQPDVDTELARTCLTYLCFDDLADIDPEEGSEELARTFEDFKFLQYAAEFWGLHASAQGDDDKFIQEDVLNLLHPEKSQTYNLWLFVYRSGRGSRIFRNTEDNVYPLYFAALFGLANTAKTLLEDRIYEDDEQRSLVAGHAIEAAASEGHVSVLEVLLKVSDKVKDQAKLGKSLYAASSRGQADAVKLLLEFGAAIDFPGKRGTPLQIASIEGYWEVVNELLDKGAKIEPAHKRYGTPLAAAAEKGHEHTVKTLLERKANVNGRGGWYGSPLVSAIVGNDDYIINKLLSIRGIDVNIQGGRHTCPLMAAAALGKLALIETLIKRGARVNDDSDKGADALYAACAAGNIDVVEILLKAGANPNAKGGKYRNALNAASAEGNVEVVQKLLEHDAKPDAFDQQYGNALQVAAYSNHENVVRALNVAGVDVNATGGHRGTALVAAASAGYENIIKTLFQLGVPSGDTQDMANALVAAILNSHENVGIFLLGSGVDVERFGTKANSLEAWSPLQAACSAGDFSMIKLLLQKGAKMNATGGNIGSALLANIDGKKRDFAIVELLLESGADVNAQVTPPTGVPTYGFALGAAVASNDLDITRLLLGHGADVNMIFDTHLSALQRAANMSDEIFDLLIEQGANVNLVRNYIHSADDPDPDGDVTPLQAVACRGTVPMARKLVELGARFSVGFQGFQQCQFNSALQAAALNKNHDVLQILVELGANVNEGGGLYGPALLVAAMIGDCHAINMLLDKGANINISGGASKGNALIEAVGGNHLDAVSLLVKRGADINSRTRHKYAYPLQCAAWSSPGMVELLIKLGANIDATGGKYYTALQASALRGNHEVMRHLLDAGADVNANGGMFGTALQAALHHGFHICTGILLDHKAKVNLTGGIFWCALESTLEQACWDLCRKLISEHNADINIEGGAFGFPLQKAIYNKKKGDKSVKYLLEKGADPNKIGGIFGTAMNAAAAKADLESIELLLEHGADISLNYGQLWWSPLQSASLQGHVDVVELFLTKGAKVNDRGGMFGTALQSASYRGYKDIVNILIKAGADVNSDVPTSRYGCPLQAAAVSGKESVLYTLLGHGAKADLAPCGPFHTSLQAAVLCCHIKTIERLLKSPGVDETIINAKGGRHGSALNAAAAVGRLDVVKLLVEHGAEVKMSSPAGKYGSALQAACASGSLPVVRYLLEKGADPDARGGFHGRPVFAAARHGHVQIVRMLFPMLVKLEVDCPIEYPRGLNALHRDALAMADETLKSAAMDLVEGKKRLRARLSKIKNAESAIKFMNRR